MRKLILQMMTTADGYFEGPNREIDWHIVDEEFNRYAIDNLNNADALIFKRVTYELMASYWPTPNAASDDPLVAAKMNSLPKFVISKSLKTATWQNTRLINDDYQSEISKLKRQEGKNLLIFGSSDLAVSLLSAGLLDEIAVFISPILLGRGKPLFQGCDKKIRLNLLSTRVFHSGNVLLIYRPV